MRITHLGHAAVLVETDDAKILIDPGNFSDGWHGQTDLDAVLITHLHPDHLDPENVPALLAANPNAKLYTEAGVAGAVAAGNLPDLGALQQLSAGDTVNIGKVLVEAVGGQHAIIHRDIPQIGNVGLVLRAESEPTLFHPGDSYAAAPEGVDVLAVPAYGPWAALKETVDFVRAVGATQGFAIHDELLSDRGRGLIGRQVGALTPLQLVDLRSGTPHTF